MDNKIEILRQQLNELHQQDWNQVAQGTKAKIWAERREHARQFAMKLIEGKIENAEEIIYNNRNHFKTLAELVGVTGVPHFLNLTLNVVARVTQLHPSTIRSKGRKGDAVKARHIFCHLVYNISQETDSQKIISLNQIGAFLSGRDHSTIINSCNVCNDLLETDKLFREQYHSCRDQLLEHLGNLTVDKVA